MKIKFIKTRLTILIIISVSLISCNKGSQADTNIESATFFDDTLTTERILDKTENDKIQELNAEISELKSQIQVLNDEISKLKSKTHENSLYEMFYGEWEVTDCIYVDYVPIRGVHYDETMLKERPESILKGISAKKIQFTGETAVINRDEVIDNIRYEFIIFPADDNYKLHFTMTLKDIGLTEVNGNYFVFVEVKSGENNAFDGSEFFIKDENTLVMYRGSYCIEYTRISYDGGSEDPVIIKG